MNNSGSVVPALISRSGASIDDLVVVCDNMDLAPGELRIKQKGTSRSHNGLASIMDAAGTGDFVRIYVGVGRPAGSDDTVGYVLGVPGDEEASLLTHAIDRAVDAVEQLLDDDVERVMNRVNARQ